jgi:N-acetylmuramoyl-L-alanine amidase
MFKRVAVALTTLLFITTMLSSFQHLKTAHAQDGPFPDVSSTYRAVDEINYLVGRHIIGGYPDGTFRPENPVTRAEAASMLGRALGLPGGHLATPFSDVPATHYASGYIKQLADKGIIAGYPNGKFGVNDQLTREQMTSIIIRAFTEFSATGVIHYADVTQDMPTYIPINKATTAGIVGGYPDGTFKPKADIKRADFSLILARALDPEFRSAPGQATTQAVVTADVLNVRSGPSLDATQIGQIVQNTIVTVYSSANGWAYITSGNLTGYVSTDFISVISQTGYTPTTIVVDAGHGGSDQGADGFGLLEKDITLNVALKVEAKLKAAGYNVVMTRTTDVLPSLDERVAIAENSGADAFVSIHCNAFDGSAEGTETYYYAYTPFGSQSKTLASMIQGQLVTALQTTNRGIKSNDYRVITNNTVMPSVLTELGFIDNAADAAKLGSDLYRDKAATAIVAGINDYFKK